MTREQLRNLPAIHQLVENDRLANAIQTFGRDAVVAACRASIDRARADILAGNGQGDLESLLHRVDQILNNRPALYQNVLNATGVILHTNLGRAPLPEAAWQAMARAAGYCDLEMDLDSGKRASRLRDVQAPLSQLTGAESGLIVNNNAAAVLLAIAGLAGPRPTAISRGHLVEIGGSFRLPDILEVSGSPMMEVGSTNRTHLQDYAKALENGARLILLVHKSNFNMSGFVAEPTDEEVISLAKSHQVPVVLDLGSGNFTDTAPFGLPDETTVPKAIAKGFDAVCFSGDKLLGGPQAGIIVGTHSICQKLGTHPLARALRADKVQLAGVLSTLHLYLRGEAMAQIPIWNMLQTPLSDLERRAQNWREQTGRGTVISTVEAIGGGSLPDAKLPGVALSLPTSSPQGLLKKLRTGTTPVVGHIVDDHVLLHPRTIHPNDDLALIDAVTAALSSEKSP